MLAAALGFRKGDRFGGASFWKAVLGPPKLEGFGFFQLTPWFRFFWMAQGERNSPGGAQVGFLRGSLWFPGGLLAWLGHPWVFPGSLLADFQGFQNPVNLWGLIGAPGLWDQFLGPLAPGRAGGPKVAKEGRSPSPLAWPLGRIGKEANLALGFGY